MRHTDTELVNTEAGFTLIEVVITVALISIAFVGILSAVGGLVISGVQNRNAAATEATVRNVAAYAQSFSSTPYLPCASTYDVSHATIPAGLSAAVTKVQFWDGNAAPAGFGNTCPPGGDQGLELVTVTVSSSSTDLGGAFSKSLTVLKRNTP